jgi:hypothetical protein
MGAGWLFVVSEVVSDDDASLCSGELPSSCRGAPSGALSFSDSFFSEATPIADSESTSADLVALPVEACGTIASSAPELSGCVFLVDDCGLVDECLTPPLSCPASPCCGESSNSVRLSKTFLNRLACDASVPFESNDGAREATGTWREASAGAERITAPLMQVRDHNGRRRLSAR